MQGPAIHSSEMLIDKEHAPQLSNYRLNKIA